MMPSDRVRTTIQDCFWDRRASTAFKIHSIQAALDGSNEHDPFYVNKLRSDLGCLSRELAEIDAVLGWLNSMTKKTMAKEPTND